tara:strand:- start:292 stop:477 length:186 start_codon:yes stop_codon:yes gene_type:complete
MQINKIALAEKRFRSEMDDSQLKELIKSRKSKRKIYSNEKMKLKQSNLKHSEFHKKDSLNF